MPTLFKWSLGLLGVIMSFYAWVFFAGGLALGVVAIWFGVTTSRFVGLAWAVGGLSCMGFGLLLRWFSKGVIHGRRAPIWIALILLLIVFVGNVTAGIFSSSTIMRSQVAVYAVLVAAIVGCILPGLLRKREVNGS
jgi:hypothetical protein